MSTPHNRAEKGEIAKKVLMPGDPLRAKFIAETFLQNVRLVNDVRNMYAYTGIYKDEQITVMASGMGMPSMGIYSYELFGEYEVEQIIRIGSAGAYIEDLELKDLVLAQSVWSESSYAHTQNGYESDIVFPDPELNETILQTAADIDIPVKTAVVHSTDVFYCNKDADYYKEIYRAHRCVCVDMESFALFHNAKVFGKKAACLLSISDIFPTGEVLDAGERQTAFRDMMSLALEASV